MKESDAKLSRIKVMKKKIIKMIIKKLLTIRVNDKIK